MFFKRSSIRTRLFIAFVLLCLFPVAAIGILAGILVTRNAENQVYEQLEMAASLKEAEVQIWKGNLLSSLTEALAPQTSSGQILKTEELIAGVSSLAQDGKEAARQLKDQWLATIASTGLFKEILLVKPDGTVILSTQDQPQGQQNDAPYLQALPASPVVLPPYVNNYDRLLEIDAVIPLVDENGKTIGLLVGKSDLEELNALFMQNLNLGISGEAYLVLSPDILLTPSRFEGYLPGRENLSSEGIRIVTSQHVNGSGRYRNYYGQMVAGVFHWLPSLNTALVVEQSLSEATRPSKTLLTYIALAAGGATLLAILAAWFITRQITGPIHALVEITRRVAGGDLSLVAPVKGEGEIDTLAQSFNSITTQLRVLINGLEHRVAERTHQLEHRTKQVQTAAEVVREVTTIHDPGELLNRAAQLIRDRFKYYYTGIFLVDERGEWVVLKAASGEAGRLMLEHEQKHKAGEAGMIGYVTGTGQSRIILDVGADAHQFRNPLLPATRSEIVLPLRVAGKVTGALDIQSTEEAAFDDEDASILQTMADQLAVASENARLFQEMGQTLNRLEKARGRYTQDAWDIFIRRTGRTMGYRNRGLGIEPINIFNPESIQALQQNQAVIKPLSEANNSKAKEGSALAIPIRLRGEVIGVINLRFEGPSPSPDMVSMHEEVANRLALLMENTRLLDEAQRLAEREQRVNLISTQVRSSLDVESILQNTVRELGKALGTSRAYIQIGIPEVQEQSKPDQEV